MELYGLPAAATKYALIVIALFAAIVIVARAIAAKLTTITVLW